MASHDDDRAGKRGDCVEIGVEHGGDDRNEDEGVAGAVCVPDTARAPEFPRRQREGDRVQDMPPYADDIRPEMSWTWATT
jgi:hypothetical protein